MSALTNLVTVYKFRGKEYLVNLNNVKHRSGTIELKITDKKTLEEWQGLYDSTYIENLTHKTGNFKRFDTFISMLKSGLLTTSQCVSLDLLTLEDLEMLRSKPSSNSQGFTSSHTSQMFSSSNKRYLIVTYTVEFDRIHYPLALEYSGPPDPKILQETIQRLEKQVTFLENQLRGSNIEEISNQIDSLQKKVVDVTSENVELREQINRINSAQFEKYPCKKMDVLVKSVNSLENKLKSGHEIIDKLQKENSQLSVKLEKAFKTERFLRSQLKEFQFGSQFNDRGHTKKAQSPSPTRNRSLNQCFQKSFRTRKKAQRKMWASSLDMGCSSSEDSVGRKDKAISNRFQFRVSPKIRSSSPTFSELSHNSGLSKCGCKNCLDTQFLTGQNQLRKSRPKHVKVNDRDKLIKRIQSLENLISGIVLK